MDWKRAFALTFWYGSENEFKQEAIAEAVARYSHNVEDARRQGVRVPPPLPPYLEAKTLGKKSNRDYGAMWHTSFGNNKEKEKEKEKEKGKERKTTRREEIDTEEKDTIYHLLRLYCDRAYGVSKLIGGGGHTPAPLDSHLSWLLCSLFISMDQYAPPPSLYRLYHSYAAQLEAVGLWQWAIYILLHLPVDSSS